MIKQTREQTDNRSNSHGWLLYKNGLVSAAVHIYVGAWQVSVVRCFQSICTDIVVLCHCNKIKYTYTNRLDHDELTIKLFNSFSYVVVNKTCD